MVDEALRIAREIDPTAESMGEGAEDCLLVLCDHAAAVLAALPGARRDDNEPPTKHTRILLPESPMRLLVRDSNEEPPVTPRLVGVTDHRLSVPEMGLDVIVTRSGGSDGAIVVFIDGPHNRPADTNPDGSPRMRVLLNDDPVYTGAPFIPSEEVNDG